MTYLTDYLAVNWFALLILGVGLIASAVAVGMRRRLENRFLLALTPGEALIVAAVGALLIPESWALWIGVVGITGLCLAVFALLLTSFWSRWIGWSVALLTMLGIGGFCFPSLGRWLWEGGRSLADFGVLEPSWLILFALVPPVFNHVSRSVGLPDSKTFRLQVMSTVLQSLIVVAVAPLLVLSPSTDNWTALCLYVFAALLMAFSWKPVNRILASIQVGLPLLIVPFLILKWFGKVSSGEMAGFFQGWVLMSVYSAAALLLVVTPVPLMLLTRIEVWRPIMSGTLRCAHQAIDAEHDRHLHRRSVGQHSRRVRGG